MELFRNFRKTINEVGEEVPTSVVTAWGGALSITTKTVVGRNDKGFIVVQFTNGSMFRTRKQYMLDDLIRTKQLLIEHVTVKDFPWKDPNGESQWSRIDPDALHL